MIIPLLKTFAFATIAIRKLPPVFMSGTGDMLINSKVVRSLLGDISSVTLHRWQKGLNERCRNRIVYPLADFPSPAVVINGRRYWRRDDIEKFISARAAKAA